MDTRGRQEGRERSRRGGWVSGPAEIDDESTNENETGSSDILIRKSCFDTAYAIGELESAGVVRLM